MTIKQVPQRYYVPALGIEIKVEVVNTSRYVAWYPTGPERVTYSEVREGDWERRGNWEEKEPKKD